MPALLTYLPHRERGRCEQDGCSKRALRALKQYRKGVKGTELVGRFCEWHASQRLDVFRQSERKEDSPHGF